MPYQPGWLAVHGAEQGEVLGLRKLNVTEALNIIPGTQAPPIDFYTGWFVYGIPQGGVELYPVLSATGDPVGVEDSSGGARPTASAATTSGRRRQPRACRGIAAAKGIAVEWSGAGGAAERGECRGSPIRMSSVPARAICIPERGRSSSVYGSNESAPRGRGSAEASSALGESTRAVSSTVRG